MQSFKVSIDINKLTDDELGMVRAILYRDSDWRTDEYRDAMHEIMQREAFVSGWMSPRQEREYLASRL